MSVSIELLYWQDCPSWPQALEMLEGEMAAVGIDRAALEVREIETDVEARSESFPGSPTIRIDGRDIQDPGDSPLGLSCRVYRRRDGRTSPLPDPLDLRDALGRLRLPGDE